MAGYTAPVTNRTSASFFNVADWTRIYRNGHLARSLAEIKLSTTILFDLIGWEPTNTTVNGVTVMEYFNILLANLERLRLAVAGETIPGTGTEIKDDWIAGMDQDIFDYEDVNYWESMTNAIWDYWSGDSLSECPTLSANLVVTTGEVEIYVDCITPGNYAIQISNDGIVYII